MSRRQVVLVIDDSLAIHKLIQGMLRDMAVDVQCVCHGGQGLQRVSQVTPDLVLLDVNLPDMDGFAVCRQLKENPFTADIPVIFLTGSEGDDDKVRAFELGATDYVVKPFSRGELRARVGAALRTRAMVSLLEDLANHDQLTGLSNRQRFHECLLAVTSVQNSGRQTGVMFLDLNRFKFINDTLGHAVGDELLVQVAKRIRSTLNASAGGPVTMAARLGGDEFAILVRDVCSTSQLTGIAQAVHEAIAQPLHIGGHEICTSTSIGIAATHAGCSAEELLRDADTAMYHAKTAGQQYVLFDRAMREKLSWRLKIEMELRKAIARKELELHYQPLIALDSGRLVGFEALVRWPHASEGMIPPDRFIPVAEDTGLIVPLGEWVFAEACRQIGQWRRKFSLPLCMNVNVSRRQLMQPDIVPVLCAAIEQASIEPEWIHVEVTENAIMQDWRAATEALQRIRGAGIKVEMDDFGTGHSSLSCLHKFPLDGLKIDRSFISNMAQQRDYTAVVQAIVMLAFNLGMNVVAEGVEEAAQVVQLQALGCTTAQGYFFGKPMAAQSAEEFMARHMALLASA